jgi:hypothetical protein
VVHPHQRVVREEWCLHKRSHSRRTRGGGRCALRSEGGSGRSRGLTIGMCDFACVFARGPRVIGFVVVTLGAPAFLPRDRGGCMGRLYVWQGEGGIFYLCFFHELLVLREFFV